MPHSIADTPNGDPAIAAAHPDPHSLTEQELRDWDDFERSYYEDNEKKLKQEDAVAELDYETRKANIWVQLTQSRREKEILEKRIEKAEARVMLLEEGLRDLDNEHRVHKINVQASRNRANFDLKERFRKSRQAGPLNADTVRQLRLVGPSMMTLPSRGRRDDVNGSGDASHPPAASKNIVPVESATKVMDAPGNGLTRVTICRADGVTIGMVEPLSEEPRVAKNSVKVLLDLPIKRAVTIREGRRFGPTELDSIYQSNDGRFSKWFSCMIQAVGDERPNPCDVCSRNAGPFVSCVRVDGASPRCGNCEWSRRGCHDADDNGVDGQYASTAPSDAEPNDAASQRPSRQVHVAKGDPNLGFKAANAAMRRPLIAPAPARSENSVMSTPVDGHPSGPPAIDYDLEELRSPEITMRHDGHVYTYPALMAGVPLEKIDPNHPYWEPAWKDPAELIRNTLVAHEEKYNQFVQDPKDKPHHNKYFHGRQVNRGRETLEFLEEGGFHPFQLVGKRWMSPAITTYDTLHRLAGTLKELAKFKVTVSPTDWLRQRLCEIMEERGDGFNLANIVKLLYHDPKVQALRQLSGFGNVGRPVKGMSRDSMGGGSRRKRKRKETSGGGAMLSPAPKRTKKESSNSTGAAAAGGSDEPQPATALSSAVDGDAAAEDDLGYEGYTDTESECGVTLGDNDFQLRTLRTARFATSEAITQYWHLSPHAGLDLQLLQSIDPPEWTGASRVRGQPVEDFSVAVEDIREVRYHPEPLLVRLALRSGEVVMVGFLRDRTMRRFVGLCRGRGREVQRTET